MANKSFKTDDEKDLSFEERQLRFQEKQLELEERRIANEERTIAVQEAGLRVQKAQLEQTKPKSLAQPPNISPFNLRGQKDFPMPVLKCLIYAPHRLDPNYQAASPQETREEVELWNLLEPGECRFERMDGETVTIVVLGSRNQVTNELESMRLCGPKDSDSGQYTGIFTKENRGSWGPMTGVLRAMLDALGIDHSHVITMKAEAKLIAAGKVEELADRVNPYPVSVGA